MTTAGPAARDIPESIRQRFQDGKRADIRRQAAADAAAFIRGQTSWTKDSLHTLVRHLQTDWHKGKQRYDRFSQGLGGQQELWLAEAMDKVGAWLGAVREAARRGLDDDEVSHLLEDFWATGIKGPYMFPTAVLSVLAPDEYVAFTEPMIEALNVLEPGASYKRTKEPGEYIRVCLRLRAMCKQEGWPLCLADAAMQVSPESLRGHVRKTSRAFSGYSAASVAFLRSLAEHTDDPAWHRENKEQYQMLLRDPTMALVREIAARFIVSLDPEVADSKRRTSILKKQDFGGTSYHAHYWFAFYDPAAASKTESVQLYASFLGDRDCFRYGLGVGRYAQRYQDNLLAALRASPVAIAGYLQTLPDGLQLRLDYHDGSERTESVNDLADALRNEKLDDILGDANELRSVCIERCVAPLSRLVDYGPELREEIGNVFFALWMLFEAARTGRFAGDLLVTPTERPEEPETDDEAPDSLVALEQETSLPQRFLRDMEEALLARGQVVLVGPPGTSKTYIAQQFARYFVRYQPGLREQGEQRTIYMHTSWAYEDFFEGIRPKVGVSGLEFAHHRGAFLSWVEDTVKKGPPTARYVLVLDEINRCDTAAVLGELLQLMEYRGQQVQLLSGRTFSLPRKLYLIGTMNSADRSIGRLDLALRRRFLFLDLYPDPNVLHAWLRADESRNPSGFEAEALQKCNAWLEEEHGIPKEQQVGHALFMPSAVHGDGEDEDGALTSDMLRRIVRYSVVPYVRELLLERGRTLGPALSKVEEFFSKYWAPEEDEDE